MKFVTSLSKLAVLNRKYEASTQGVKAVKLHAQRLRKSRKCNLVVADLNLKAFFEINFG